MTHSVFPATARAAGCCIAAVASFAAVAAETYPTRPVRMIVAVPPGGPADVLARIVGPRLTEPMGQVIVIDNRPGANGIIAYDTTARAAPDGYTFCLAAAGIAINPSLYRSVPYDPIRDFAPITKGAAECATVAVAPAITNAIADAVGVRVRRLPATPQRLLALLALDRADTKPAATEQ